MTTPIEALGRVVNVCLLTPGVIGGGQPSAADIAALGGAGGGILLDLRDRMEPRPFDEPAEARAAGLEYANIPVSGAALDDTTMERILGVLRSAEGRTVFVHCGSGNRVGGALLPYLMIDHGFDEEDAVNQAMRVGLRGADLLEWGLDYARRNAASS